MGHFLFRKFGIVRFLFLVGYCLFSFSPKHKFCFVWLAKCHFKLRNLNDIVSNAAAQSKDGMTYGRGNNPSWDLDRAEKKIAHMEPCGAGGPFQTLPHPFHIYRVFSPGAKHMKEKYATFRCGAVGERTTYAVDNWPVLYPKVYFGSCHAGLPTFPAFKFKFKGHSWVPQPAIVCSEGFTALNR